MFEIKKKLKIYFKPIILRLDFITANADTEPRRWENECMSWGILGMILYAFLSDHALNYFVYNDYLYIKGSFWFLFVIGAIPYGIRATKSIIILLYKRTIPSFGDGLSGYFFTAAAISWKLKKPILAGCFGCIGSICGASDFYQSRFGFSPLREFWLSYDNHQTWDQAKQHIFDPTKYNNSNVDPYIQDMLVNQNEQLINQKEQLANQQNELIRQQNELIKQQNELAKQQNEIAKLKQIVESYKKK